MPRPLTPAQQKQRAERLERMQQPVPEADDPTLPASEPATLAITLGEGEEVTINGAVWKIGPYVTKNIRAGYALINHCPALLVAVALASKGDEPVDLARATDIFNNLTGREDSASDVASLLTNLHASFSEEANAAMLEFVLFALRRHHPDVTAADLEDDFDLGTFIRCVRAVYRVNSGMRAAF